MALIVFAGQRFPIGGEMLLGRHRDCGIHLPDEQSSRKHARIYQDAGSWWIEDLASANGTRLNGRALITGAAKIVEGDRIAIGSLELRFHLTDPQATKEQAAVPPPVDLLNRVIADQRIEKPIGRVATGTIYKAWHAKRERHVAFKAIDPRLTANPEFAERFLRDITVVAGIQHAAVVRIFQCAQTDGVLWYATELIVGETLAQMLKGPIEPRRALTIGLSLAEALQVYHQHGLVHGDVKPASVMIDDKKQLRILDLGLIGVTHDEGRMLQADASPIQACYVCPAQALGGQSNVRSDIYSLGCILYHLLAGRPPYDGATTAEVIEAHERRPIPLIAESRGLPMKLDDVLKSMLSKDPFWRYEAMEFVAAEIRAVRALLPDD